MSKGELVVTLQVAGGGQQFAAMTELGGNPICSYGATADEATRRAKAVVLRLLASLFERDQATVEVVRFRVR